MITFLSKLLARCIIRTTADYYLHLLFRGYHFYSNRHKDQGCAQEKRVKGGTQQITAKCLDFVAKHSEPSSAYQLRLNTVVIAIKQSDSNETEPVQVVCENTVTGERITYRARKVVSSLPMSEYAKVTFTPSLPFVKRNLFKFYQAGNYIKYIVTYRHAFWRNKGFSGQGTFDGSCKWIDETTFNEVYKSEASNKLSFRRRMPTLGAAAECWDGSDENGEPALVGFVAGQCAVEWADQTDALREREVIEDLVRLFGEEARDYVAYVDKQWCKC